MKAIAAARAHQQGLKNKANAAQAAQQAFDQRVANANAGGYRMTEDMLRRQEAINQGEAQGRKTFITDPRMQEVLKQYQDRAKGYDSSVLGGVRQEARGQIAGQQQAAQRRLSSSAARGGVGGARGAAMQSQAQLQGGQQVASAERGMALENAQMKMKQGENLSDFMVRQQMGVAGAGAGYAGMASSDYAAKEAAKANKGGGSTCCAMIALTFALSGINHAEAAQIIKMSKGTEFEKNFILDQYKDNQNVLNFINDLNEVRFVRDNYCSKNELRGYYQFSETIVPFIEKNPIIAKIGRIVLVEPIKNVKSKKLTFKKFVGLAWIKSWGIISSNEPFKRSNGEVV